MSDRKTIFNLAASIKDRLLNIARENKQGLNLVFRQYVQERFLYRLANSLYSNNFILKGALLFLAYDISKYRPTRDIDFKGDSIPNNTDDLIAIFKEIIEIKYEDGLIFSTNEISAEEITEKDKYQGVRIKLKAMLGTMYQILQIDIGFGDVIYQGPVDITFPVLLDFPAPVIRAYSIESAIAEKFEAIVSLGRLTSRMKDFYDILFFANKQKLESNSLSEAIILTFRNRHTDISARSLIYKTDFKTDEQKQTQWAAFLVKNKLEADKDFEEAMNKLVLFIEPLFEQKELKIWNPEEWSWE